jgi:hypothetical protein
VLAISVIGSVQDGSGALVLVAGGVVRSSLLYARVGIIASLRVPMGTGAVLGVVVLEAMFGSSGTLARKEGFGWVEWMGLRRRVRGKKGVLRTINLR